MEKGRDTVSKLGTAVTIKIAGGESKREQHYTSERERES